MTTAAPQLIQATLAQLNKVIHGKEQQVQLALTCLLANGHLLLEDLPGMGKTTLAHALAQVCGLEYKRVQFTSDLLPADLIGAAIFEQQAGRFRFHPGPVFSQVFLADELNRATPKAQSALLEAMEERQVSVDGVTHPLPAPFFVIATQNPQSQAGTFPLPESQLDRFLIAPLLRLPRTSGRTGIAERPQRAGIACQYAAGVERKPPKSPAITGSAGENERYLAGLCATPDCLHPPNRCMPSGAVATRGAGVGEKCAGMGIAARARACIAGRCASDLRRRCWASHHRAAGRAG